MNVFGQRLRLARKKAGLSMRELASALQPPLSAQAISKYEAGDMMPSSSVLVGLGQALGVSLDFLMSGQIAALDGVEFRKHSGTTAQDRARVEAIVLERLEDYLAIEQIVGVGSDNPFGGIVRDRIDHADEAEQVADQLRMHWRLGIDPIPSMTALLEDKGIKVIEAHLPPQFDGLACSVSGGDGAMKADAIVVSTRKSIERKRFSLAHELAHRVIHQTSNPAALKLEKAMNRFAGAFLVPKAHLMAELGRVRSVVSYAELKRLKHYYGVSAVALLYRMKDVSILPSDAVDYAFRSYARPWRINEPDPLPTGDAAVTIEKPARFEALVFRALAEQLISLPRAAQLLKLPVPEVEYRLRGPRHP
jgi:Zn-dependent peptidase ImmA (M78 family)/DNA-binding XRE family transcriptional regulator